MCKVKEYLVQVMAGNKGWVTVEVCDTEEQANKVMDGCWQKRVRVIVVCE